MNYFIADLHFGHENAIAFDGRPFNNITAHYKCLIKLWNNKVNIDDDIYILGDISWYNVTKTIDIINNLNGRKHLIIGNHDKRFLKNKEFRDCFVEVCDYKELYLNDKESIILSHYPIPCFKNHYYGWYHFYGHVHNSFEYNMMKHVKRQMVDLYDTPCHMYNVGCMLPYMDYIPRRIDEIILGAEKYETKISV